MTAQSITQIVTEFKITPDDEVAKSTLRSWVRSSWRGIVAEFLCTLMLLLFGCMTCIPVEGIDMTIYIPFGFGFVALLNIQIFGHFSGAYMNPVVTLASVIWGSTSIPLGIMYAIAEFSGALVGYGILLALSPVDMVAQNVCVTAPHADLSGLQSVGIEALLAAALILFNCGMWDPMNANYQDSAPIKFGLTIVALNLVGGPLTGTSMNPARSFAPVVWTGYWTNYWIYLVGPCLGGTIAAVFYRFALLKKPEIY